MGPDREVKIHHVLNRRQPDLTVVLENVEDPHNIFAVMRTCDAIGVGEVYVLNTLIGSHRKFGKKSSASAAKWVAMHRFDNTDACMSAVKQKYDHIFATHLDEHQHSLYELELTGSVALVFGNERAGVSDECLSYCDGSFVIPQVGMIPSLNISVACAVTLYEAYRQRELAGFYNGTPRLQDDALQELERRWSLPATATRK